MFFFWAMFLGMHAYSQQSLFQKSGCHQFFCVFFFCSFSLLPRHLRESANISTNKYPLFLFICSHQSTCALFHIGVNTLGHNERILCHSRNFYTTNTDANELRNENVDLAPSHMQLRLHSICLFVF